MQSIKMFFSKDQGIKRILYLFLTISIFILWKETMITKVKNDSVFDKKYEGKLDIFMNSLRDKENEKIQEVKEIQVSSLTNNEARMKFFQIISMPLQSTCRILKRIGGHWHIGDRSAGQNEQIDGDKFVCMDSILEKDDCIVYSFGLAADWTFEDMMDLMGCKIFAYDHTIDAPELRGQNIRYFKTGLGFGEDLKPLSKLIAENGHKGVEIDYLKIDIEEYEFSEGGFRDWINSGALNYVRQIAIELHVEHREENSKQYNEILQHLQDLYKLGFRVISHEVNMVKGPGMDGIYNFVEIVLLKS